MKVPFRWPPTEFLVVLSVVVVGVLTYLPAVDNFFISDDFTLLSMLKVLDRDPLYIVQVPSEFFRVVSYVYFWACYKVFGLNSEMFYWAGIALHAIASVLVYKLVRKVTGQTLAAGVAAVFFAAYERHQEAVMWISAANDAILAICCLVFLLLWDRYTTRGGSLNLAISLLSLLLALFAKEAAVALVPLAVIGPVLKGQSMRTMLLKSAPLFALLAGYVALWLFQAQRNFFIADGHYALGLHFLPVYLRSLSRLAAPAVPFALLLLIVACRRGKQPLVGPSLVFFSALLVLAVVPYSFLTYMNHIPSRNTYFPSVGLAGLVGILFTGLFEQLETARGRRLASYFLACVVGGNIAYIWLKKEPQYLERSAPTRQLIHVLNTYPDNWKCVSGFPLHPWIGREAIAGFTSLQPDTVVFSDHCENAETVLFWNQKTERYVAGPPSLSSLR